VDVHIGDLALHELEGCDRLAELLALMHVGSTTSMQACMMPLGRRQPPRVHSRGHSSARYAAADPLTLLLRHFAILRTPARQVSEPRMPSLSSSARWKNPFIPFDDEGGDAARPPPRRSWRRTTSVSADGALVIHILLPLSTKAVALFVGARLQSTPRRKPAPGSDIANDPTCSPNQLGKYLRFCASLPFAAESGLTQRLDARRRTGRPRPTPRHLFHRKAVLEIAETGPPYFLLHGNAVQAERANFRARDRAAGDRPPGGASGAISARKFGSACTALP